MLTWDQVREYFSPEIVQRNPRGILVEYLQFECLDSLFKQQESEALVFIGGTAIRIIYNSQRFSEDLDFDNYHLSHADLTRWMEKSIAEMRLKGFELVHRFSERGGTFHCYLKFPNLLHPFGLSGHREERIFISVDAQRKKKVAEPEIRTLNRFGIFRNITVHKASVLLSQKLMAILGRKRERGRDFYDVSFLSGFAKPDEQYVEARTGMSIQEFKETLLKRCTHFNYKSLAEDVEPFLFNPEQKERVLGFARTITQILG